MIQRDSWQGLETCLRVQGKGCFWHLMGKAKGKPDVPQRMRMPGPQRTLLFLVLLILRSRDPELGDPRYLEKRGGS